ncbi:MAG: hypothetical protein JXC85_03325 [Candidatus Aenigmarchaeota archaeon]|nr:hypothetical protein [Candidatus Aenigmarchaeota archaeon]
MTNGKEIAVFSIILLVFVPGVAARSTTFLSMNPDAEYCISVVFGDNGRGEYTLTIDDPDYPRSVWVDTHRASFTSGPSNPVIVPVCFTTKGRRVGEEAMLRMNLETPERLLTFDYGICVSEHEDADVVESSDDPCDASNSHTDVFNADLLESEKFAIPGERVTFTLLLSSEFDMRVLLDKESGPKMNITSTVVDMPAEQTVGIVIDSPLEPGDYPFTIAARAEDCDDPSCLKRLAGVLHVSQVSSLEGFRIELSPRNKNVAGIQAARFYITIHNFDAEQLFGVSLAMDQSLKTDFNSQDVRVSRDKSAQIEFTVIPGSSEHRLYIIRAEAEAEDGGKKSADSFLTVEEPVSDADRYVESDPKLKPDADGYAESYRASPSLEEWQEIQDLGSTSGEDDEQPAAAQPGPLNWILIAAAVFAIAAIIFLIYKRTVVARGPEETFY